MNVLGRFVAVLAVPMVLHGFYHVDDLLGGWGTSWFVPLNGCVGDPACHALLNVPGYVALAVLAIVVSARRAPSREGGARAQTIPKRGDLCAVDWCRTPRLEGEAFCYRHVLQAQRQAETEVTNTWQR